MRLLRHLVVTDLRHFRWILAGWIAVVAFATALQAIPAPGDYDPTGTAPIALARSLLGLVQAILLVAVVPVVVHTYPAVGTNPFWMTRPLPVRVVVGSRLVLLAGAVLVPAVAAGVAMAGYQVAARYILLVSAEAAIGYASLLIALMVIASWTPDLWRFALVIVAIGAGIAGALTLLLMVMVRRMSESPMADPGNFWLSMIFLPLYVMAACAVLVVQYRTRQRTRSVPVAIAGLLVAVTLAWDRTSEGPPAAPEWAAANVQIVPDLSTIETQPGFSYGGPSEWRTVNARVGVGGVPQGWSGSVTLADAALDLGGIVLSRSWSRPVTGNAQVYSGTVSMASDGSAQPLLPALLGVGRILYPETEPPPKTVVFAVTGEEFSQHAQAIGRYTSRFWVSLTRHDVEAVMTLHDGTIHRGDWYRFVVDGVERSPRGLTVLLRQSLAVAESRMNSRFSFYLRNRERDEAVEAATEYVRSDVLLQRLQPFGLSVEATPNTGFGIYRLRMNFPPRYRLNATNERPLDEDWFRAAELIVIRSTPAGAVLRTVDIAEFPLSEASRSAREF